MNNDKLLAKINYEIDLELQGMDAESWHAGARALRAVVELHIEEGIGGMQCVNCEYPYPCPTIQAIEKELK